MNKAEQITGQIDALAALRAEKDRVRNRINASGERIGQIAQKIVSPISDTSGSFLSFGSVMSNGYAIYQGIRIGSRVVRSLTSLFRRKRY